MCLKPLRHDVVEGTGYAIHLPDLGGVFSVVLQCSVVCGIVDEMEGVKLKSQELYTWHLRMKGGVCPV